MTEAAAREIGQERLEELNRILDSGSAAAVREMLSALHPAEIADLIESLPSAKRMLLWKLVPRAMEGAVLLEVGEEVRESLVTTMDSDEIRAVAAGLDLDDLADFVQSLPDTLIDETLAGMEQQERHRLEQVLSYDEESAGGLMNLDAVTVRADVSLDVVLRYLRLRGDLPPHTDHLIVVDRHDRYCGVLSLRSLLTHPAEQPVAAVMDIDYEPINVKLSDAEVVRRFEDRNLVSAPVVDDHHRLLGRITVDDVFDVMREDAEQAVMSMAGLDQDDDIFSPVVKSSRKRAVWLGVNLLTAFLASWVIGQFEGALDQVVALAILMPVVASMGGIAGSQTLTLVIRGQALGQVSRTNTPWLLRKEIMVGLLNGLLWAVVVAAVAWLWFGDPQIPLVIAAATVINLLAAATAGVVIPMILRSLGVDPALAGGVILTTVTDVVGFVAFLGLATLYLID